LAPYGKSKKPTPERTVLAALITTGKIGREKGIRFPNKVPGLIYWRASAREHFDVEPIRAALLTLAHPTDLKTFLRDSRAEEIRKCILRPIRWLDSSTSIESVEHSLHEKLVYFGTANGVGAEDSKNALSALIVELLTRIRGPSPARYVTASDLLTVFQKNTYRLMPPSVLSGLAAIPRPDTELSNETLATCDANSVPLPPRAALRHDIVETLHAKLVGDGILWLHGSSGLGKTTLALLLARRQNVLWTFADLRDMNPRALRLALTRLRRTFEGSAARGLILDDLSPEPDNLTVLAISLVCRAVRDVDGTLIVTSIKPPHPSLLGKLDLAEDTVCRVPYFNQNDVSEIVSSAGGNPQKWAQVIYLACGLGHPQLVDARVVGLRQRRWPETELLADLAPLQPGSGDLEEERKAVRGRLLREIDVDSRALLLRLSLVSGNFDRPMALAMAEVAPPILQAGILFDALVGPWVEQVGLSRYRLSPLLRDSGDVGLLDSLRRDVRIGVLTHLIKRSPFPADQMMQVFTLAYPLRHLVALTWFSGALISLANRDKTLFKRLAEEVSVFSLARHGDETPLLPDDVHISILLRYAQFRVAIAIENGQRAAVILDRLLSEIELLKDGRESDRLALALATALSERSVPIRPGRWLTMLKTFTALPLVRRLLKQRPSHRDPLSGFTYSPRQDEMIFIVRATALNGIDELCELAEALNAQDAEVRERYLTATSNVLQSTTHIVSSAWLSEARATGFDGRAAATRLHDIRRAAAHWGNVDMAIELACAEAVMLDEYAHNKEEALHVLDQAQIDYPLDYRINRRRQKVYYRNGDHALALAEFESFVNSLPAARPVDRAFALREAGRSAAEIGEFDKTRTLFQMSWEAATSCGEHMGPMTAGLSADCAVLEFQAGRIEGALGLMMRALTEAESIDPKAGLKEHYCHLILIAAILWMRGHASDWTADRQEMVIGMCSNPEPPAEIRERRVPQKLLPWYELAELEAESSVSQLALIALRKRTANGGLLVKEITLASFLLRLATRNLNVDRFIEVLPTYCRAVVSSTPFAVSRDSFNPFDMPMGSLKPVEGPEWGDKSLQDAAASAIVAFSTTAISSMRIDLFQDFRARLLRIESMSLFIEPLFAKMADISTRHQDLLSAITGTLARMLRPNFVFNASEAFDATVYIVQFAQSHVLGKTVAGPVNRYFSEIWRDIIANRSFSMRSPAVNGPLILATINKDGAAISRLARLVLVTEAAVSAHLSEELRQTIGQLSREEAKHSHSSNSTGAT
jgi:tetratricopeptide (TPR) repeat protein